MKVRGCNLVNVVGWKVGRCHLSAASAAQATECPEEEQAIDATASQRHSLTEY